MLGMNAAAGGGGGVREVGTVTGGMAIMNFDEKTRPYSREDFINFISNYQANCDDAEIALIHKGMAVTATAIPLTFLLSFKLTKRLPWYRIEKMMPVPYIAKIGRLMLSFSAASIPYVWIQTWIASEILSLPSSSNLAFHVKRLMILQRNSMMFQKTETREVTKEEQERMSRDATAIAIENRRNMRPQTGGSLDVNLALGQQALTPVAQTGYKPMPPVK
jgi:hypothetical protein